tara:strand:+ start:1698 stop:2921 length:1224 start_codon:yes stop_codon:yes gene_type:complete
MIRVINSLWLIFLILNNSCNSNFKMKEKQLLIKSNKLSKKFIIVDGHIDLPYRLKEAGYLKKNKILDLTKETDGDFDYAKSKRGGLDAPFMSIYIPAEFQKSGGAKKLADSLINLVIKITNSFPTKFALANSPSDIKDNFSKGLISLPMGIENGAAIEKKLENIDYFFERGIRYITLTHGKDNAICDSSYDSTKTWNGLSPFGRKVISKMNSVGMMIDISHVTDEAFYQVIEISRTPVIASHSSPRKFTPGFERNMSDDMIIKLAESNGLILINFGSSFVNELSNKKFDQIDKKVENWKIKNKINDIKEINKFKNRIIEEEKPFATIEDVINAIDHVVKLVGIDHVGFGSDFDGLGNTLPYNLKNVSDYPNIILGLLKKNYSEEDIEKICYKNLFKTWNEILEFSKD